MMLSQCPKCETVFQISELQLQAKDGLVRCGHCQFVFNAAWNLLDVPPDDNGPGNQAPPSPPARKSPPAPAEAAPEPAAPPHDYDAPPEPNAGSDAPSEPAAPPRQPAAAAKLEAVRRAVARMRASPPAPAEAAGAPEKADAAVDASPPPPEPPPAPPPAAPRATPAPGTETPPPAPSPTAPTAAPPAEPPQAPQPPADAVQPPLELEAAQSEPSDDDESPSGGTPTLMVEATPAQQAALSEDGRWGWGMGEEKEEDAPGAQPDGRRVGPAGPEERRLFFPDHEPDEEIVLASPDGHVHDDVETPDEAPEPPASPRKRGSGLDIPSIAEGRRTPLREHTISLGSLGRRGKGRRWLWITLAVVLVLALAAQAAYFFLADAAERPMLRAGLQRVCDVVHCSVPPRRDLARVELLETRIAPHAERSDALELAATLVNRAPFAQAYPLIEVTLTNQRGEIVARRTFPPEVYLDTQDPQQALMPRNIAVDVVLAMTRPQPQTNGYEVRLAEAARTRDGVFRRFVADMSLTRPLHDIASGVRKQFNSLTGGAEGKS